MVYNVKISRIVEDDKEKLDSLLKIHLNVKDAIVEIKNDSAEIKTKASIPKNAQEEFKKIAERIIPAIKNLIWTNKI